MALSTRHKTGNCVLCYRHLGTLKRGTLQGLKELRTYNKAQHSIHTVDKTVTNACTVSSLCVYSPGPCWTERNQNWTVAEFGSSELIRRNYLALL